MVSGTNSYCRSYWCLFDHSMGLHGTGNSNVPSDARKQSHVTAVMWYVYDIFRRKFRSQTSDNMDRWKSRGGKSQRGGAEERRSEKRKSEKKEDAGARKGRKVAKHCVFPMICGSGGSKSRLAKAAGAEPCGHMRDEKLRAVVARSTLGSQNAQNCTKHFSFGALLEAEMSKKCRPLWHKAHFKVKTYKTHQLRTTFGSWDVEKARAVVARSTFRSQKCKNLRRTGHFWTFRCRFAWQAQGIVHLVKSEQNVRAL